MQLVLTGEDLELIKQLCLPNKIVCRDMGISHGALKMRTKRLMRKMGVENQRALLVKSLECNLVSVNQLVYREFDGETNTLGTSN